jgi:hypothetical protein
LIVQPRVIFTTFSGIDSPELRPWLAHVSRVLGTRAPAVAAAADPSVWQLISANNRGLARSAGVYAGFRAASDAAATTVANLASVVSRHVVDDARGLLGWYLAIDGEPVVVCSRWYLAERERSQAVNLALATLKIAVLSDGARRAPDRSGREANLHVR